jgi:hypothetical protein
VQDFRGDIHQDAVAKFNGVKETNQSDGCIVLAGIKFENALARDDDREAAQYLDEFETLAPRLRSPESIVAVVQELRAAIVSRVRT